MTAMISCRKKPFRWQTGYFVVPTFCTGTRHRELSLAEEWRQKSGSMIDTAEIFERDRYVVLPSLLPRPSLARLYSYARRVAEFLEALGPGDEQVPGTPSAYGDFIMDGLLVDLLPEIERASGLLLFPTYSYFRIYKHGDILKKHNDRPSCEISVTLCLGFEAEKPWPIWIEGRRDATSINLSPRDALLYRGLESYHWREALNGERHAQVFLHYVDQNGPNAAWKFDKRDSTAVLRPIISQHADSIDSASAAS